MRVAVLLLFLFLFSFSYASDYKAKIKKLEKKVIKIKQKEIARIKAIKKDGYL